MMKPSNTATNPQFSIPSISSFAKLTAIAVMAISSTFSVATAQDAHPGEALFTTKCSACHGPTGEGIAVFPPLAESEWVNGPAENLVRIQLRGLMGPITVKGKEFNSVMPANATMSDQEIADVLTYVRSNMGNTAPAVSVDLVKKIRAEEKGNTAPLTVKDLKPLKAEGEAKAKAETEAEAEENPEPKPAPAEKTEPEKKPIVEETPKAEAGKSGHEIYKQVCAACHQPNGEGLATAFPPLAESEWVNGPAENLIRIQLHGLTGPIEVKGIEYNGTMPANATMSDEDIASVLTYVRSNMGNSAPAVSVDLVKKIRAEEKGSTAPLTAKDLKEPVQAAEGVTERTELKGFKPAEGNGGSSIFLVALGIIGVCTLPAAAGLLKN